LYCFPISFVWEEDVDFVLCSCFYMGFYYGSDTGIFIAVFLNTSSYSFGELEGALDRGGHRAHA
jgi:hypothetical protein